MNDTQNEPDYVEAYAIELHPDALNAAIEAAEVSAHSGDDDPAQLEFAIKVYLQVRGLKP